MLAQILTLILTHLLPIQSSTDTGFATTFYPQERWNNGQFACGGRWRDPNLRVCAHRTLSCGSIIFVTNHRTNRTSWCVVRDRGPYGATAPDGSWVLKSPKNKGVIGKYRGILDVSRQVARDIGSDGRDWVTIRRRY